MSEVPEATLSIEQQIQALQQQLQAKQDEQRAKVEGRRADLLSQIDQLKYQLEEVEAELGIEPVPWKVNRLLGNRRARSPNRVPGTPYMGGTKGLEVIEIIRKAGRSLMAREIIAEMGVANAEAGHVRGWLKPFIEGGKVKHSGGWGGTYSLTE